MLYLGIEPTTCRICSGMLTYVGTREHFFIWNAYLECIFWICVNANWHYQLLNENVERCIGRPFRFAFITWFLAQYEWSFALWLRYIANSEIPKPKCLLKHKIIIKVITDYKSFFISRKNLKNNSRACFNLQLETESRCNMRFSYAINQYRNKSHSSVIIQFELWKRL